MSGTASKRAPLTDGAGLVDLPDRTQIELTGDDRATFLHNLCTNEVRKLPAGRGCQAFFLNAKGHIVAHVHVFGAPESHVLETVPGQGALLTQHLDRYLIRERVEIADRSQAWSELLVAGPAAADVLRQAAGASPPEERLAHEPATIAGRPVRLRRVEWTIPGGWLVAGMREALADVRAALLAAGAEPCDATALDAARIEAGTPWYGIDITDKNLPQEVARDAAAISFTKGCYLGQETVARIDALGHVNRTLVGVRFDGAEVPAAGWELMVDGQAAGQVTSAAWSPRLGAPLALAYVRRGSNTAGTRLSSPCGGAVVVALPLSS